MRSPIMTIAVSAKSARSIESYPSSPPSVLSSPLVGSSSLLLSGRGVCVSTVCRRECSTVGSRLAWNADEMDDCAEWLGVAGVTRISSGIAISVQSGAALRALLSGLRGRPS